MKRLWLAAALLVPAACSESERSAPAAAAAAAARATPQVTIDELAGMLERGAATPVDANGPSLRNSVGVIPGAVLLTDYETYRTDELPADRARPLVFYCANQQCGASHTAAEKAIAAGYAHVNVLPAGILGWSDAGRPVDHPPAAL